jgi:hypothetical protein
VTMFVCAVCAAVVAVASIGLGVYKMATGRKGGEWDVAAGLTFGVGAAVGRVTNAIQRGTAAAYRMPTNTWNRLAASGSIKAQPRDWSMFQRRWQRPLQRGANTFGAAQSVIWGVDVSQRVARWSGGRQAV